MSNQSLVKRAERFPAAFDDLFKPWNEWFGNGDSLWSRTLSVPAVNISEDKDHYEVSLAVPGMKKDDFKVDIHGDMLTISAENEENKTEKEKKFTRKEYSYSSFSRSFNLPEEVNKEKIEARYENGVLSLSLPLKSETRKEAAKQIAVK
ncbi:Hsp20/alpha crystallin family protein [Terrimonas sp. NA20]|uniref:Hsp20/alpha crystallin family protein n=1 Tax=Terrimonas ginsenosidimutans TaxID=2908004 RepID=A0ABS9KVA8_9BACT|nr:Hsp20/alpha crystallin family protein [Terrimonas ginsenosidimutans]MCG2616287.1 Hsp20/alpha crystallin family protein [Terrimonas ginsenosidimutans]